MATVQEALDRLWSDEALKQRLFSDPRPVLKEFGLNISENVKVHLHENTSKVFNAVLPAKPESKVPLGSDALSQTIERAWSDESFKKKLLSDPAEAAGEMGITLPQSAEVKVWENTATEEHFVLPANPVETELSEMELEAVSGGAQKGAQPAPGTSCAPVVNYTSTMANTAMFLAPTYAASSVAVTAVSSQAGKC